MHLMITLNPPPSTETSNPELICRSPVCVAVSLLQELDGLWQDVVGVAGLQQVQQDLLSILIFDHLVQRGQQLLQGGEEERALTPTSEMSVVGEAGRPPWEEEHCVAVLPLRRFV